MFLSRSYVTVLSYVIAVVAVFDRGDLYRGKRKAIQCFTIYLLRGTLPTEGLSELSLTILRESL